MESFMIMMLVLFEVALWQWRVAITIRGNLLGGVLLASSARSCRSPRSRGWFETWVT